MLFDPVIECIYGWGQVMRLSDDHLHIGNTPYALADLIAVYPTYYHIVGIASARLELCFTCGTVTLRGIAAIETAQQIVSRLNAFCRPQTSDYRLSAASEAHLDRPSWAVDIAEEKWLTTDAFLPGNAQQATLLTDLTKYAQETEVCSVPAQERITAVKMPRWRQMLQEQRQRRSKRLQAERARHEHGFDVEQLALCLQAPTLPQVSVPTRLLPGEYAHYCTDATLCEEPAMGVVVKNYRVKDQGMLILTNRRIIYIGRRRQLVLDYRRLLHVSHLHGAIGIQSESWARREIFEVRLPLECTMYLDAILLRFHRQQHDSERTHTRVRQLYPATKTHSYDMYTTANPAPAETQAHWQYSDPSK